MQKSYNIYDSKTLINKLCKSKHSLQSGDTLLLYGPMGAGKTYFTSHLCKELGCAEYACSPTYTITNHYHSPDLLVIHSDLYRLSIIDDFLIQEIFSHQTLNIIEWAEKLTEENLSHIPNYLKLHFDADHNIQASEGIGRFSDFDL